MVISLLFFETNHSFGFQYCFLCIVGHFVTTVVALSSVWFIMILQGSIPVVGDEYLCAPCPKKTAKSRGSTGFTSVRKRISSHDRTLKPLPTNSEIMEFLQNNSGCCALSSAVSRGRRCCLSNYFTIPNEGYELQVYINDVSFLIIICYYCVL